MQRLRLPDAWAAFRNAVFFHSLDGFLEECANLFRIGESQKRITLTLSQLQTNMDLESRQISLPFHQ